MGGHSLEDLLTCLQSDFLQKTQRVKNLYLQLQNEMHSKKEVWAGENTILNEENQERPLIIRKAKAFEKVLTDMPVQIKDDELVVGVVRMGSVGMGMPFPEYATKEEKKRAASKKTSPRSVWGHYVPGYPKLLKEGLRGVKEEAFQRFEKLKYEENPDQERKYFYQAVIICSDAVKLLSHRYALLASELAQKEVDSRHKLELEKISQICLRVPENPPESFYEAVQSFWFLHLAFHSTLHMVPVGRFDQYIYPFLKKDLEEGVITLREAQELVDCLWIKFNERAQTKELTEDFLDPYAFHLGGIEVTLDKDVLHQLWLQNVILGGQTAQGENATNLLTFLCLNATHKFELTNPTVTVRFFRNSPKELLRKTCEIIRSGGGMPAIFNDEAIVPALAKFGIPIEEARDYTNDGCWETLIPGKTEFRYHLINSSLCMELALNGGYSRLRGQKEGVDTPDPLSFSSFAEIMNSFKIQLDYQIKRLISTIVEFYGCLYEIAPVPFLSSTVEACLEKGLDITQGGAKYVINALLLLGLSHAVDSLSAIKKLVFEDGIVSMPELLEALNKNFEGREDLRQILITRTPKYGNNDGYADDIAKEILNYFVRKVKERAQAYLQSKIKFYTGVGSFEFYILGGKMVGALPDGRLSQEGVSPNFSPSLGMAMEGPTSIINSFTKMNFFDLPTGSPLDLSLDRKALEGKEGLERLMALVQSFLDKGGNMLTISVNSLDELRRAQIEPEKYRHLRVRMGGWQAYFVDLTRKHQDHHIARLEQYA